jgi:hypothetical protein
LRPENRLIKVKDLMNTEESQFTEADYIRALSSFGHKLTARHRAIIGALYSAPAHTASVGELAKVMKYQSRQPLNKSLQHVAEMMCTELQMRMSDPVDILASSGQTPGMEPRLTMLPALAKALEALKWQEIRKGFSFS